MSKDEHVIQKVSIKAEDAVQEVSIKFSVLGWKLLALELKEIIADRVGPLELLSLVNAVQQDNAKAEDFSVKDMAILNLAALLQCIRKAIETVEGPHA